MGPVPGVEGDPTLGRNKDETETNVRLENGSLGLTLASRSVLLSLTFPFLPPTTFKLLCAPPLVQVHKRFP